MEILAGTIFLIFVVAPLLGLIPAVIANGKGRNFILWWMYGWALFPIAFLHSLLMSESKPASVVAAERKCPMCAEAVKLEAKICKHCRHELPEVELPVLKGPLTYWSDCPECGGEYFEAFDQNLYHCHSCQANFRIID